MGALSYADDVTISCPSLYGLSIMLDIWNNFAHENFIKFNTKKTVCIQFGEFIKPQEFAKLDGQLLKWQRNFDIWVIIWIIHWITLLTVILSTRI